jgi:hypothetical protein
MNPAMLAAAIAVLLLGTLFLCMDAGFRIGRARRARRPDLAGEGAGTVDAAVFGLLGLTLAFTFSGASDRLAIRRAQIVQEANAIGTAYLRVDLLPQEDQPRIRDLYRRYLESRIQVFDKILDRAATSAALDECRKIQSEIWSSSVAACPRSTSPQGCTLVVESLNEMIDITTTRNMATLTHTPLLIFSLLVFLSLLGAMLSGYTMSIHPRRSPVHMVLFALAISSTLYVVLDLEFPRAGLINLTPMDDAIIQLREDMK